MSDQLPAGFEEVPAGFELAPAAKADKAPQTSRQSEIPAGFDEVPAGFELAPEPKSTGLNVSKDSSPVQPQASAEPEKKGLWQQTKDMITGNDRETKESRELPELQHSELLTGIPMSDLTKGILKTALALTHDTGEMAKILKASSPDIETSQDEKGNWLAVNTKTGARTVLNRPGLSKMDLDQGAATTAAFAIPAIMTRGKSLKASMALMAGGSAATESIIQLLQKSQGGDFNPEDIATSAIGGAVGEAGARGLSMVGSAAKGVLSKRAADAVADSAPATADDVTTAIIKAARKDNKRNIDGVLNAMAPKKEIVDAAERIGMTDYLTPGHMSGNGQFTANAQAVFSVPGSKGKEQDIAAVKALGQKAQDLITDFGGKVDKGQVNQNFNTNTKTLIDEMKVKAKDLYDKIEAAIPDDTAVEIFNVENHVKELAISTGEKLIPANAKAALAALNDYPSYGALKLLKSQVGQAKRLKTGPFADMDSSGLQKLEDALKADKASAAEDAGLGDVLKAADSLTAQKSALQKQFVSISGKDLKGSVVPKVGNALKNLSDGDLKSFDVTMDSIHPTMRNEVMMTAMNDVFTIGSRDSKDLAPGGFVKWYEGMQRSPVAMERMNKYMPKGAQDRMKDIHTLSRGIWDSDKRNLPNGIMTTAAAKFDKKDGFLGRLYGFGRNTAAAEGMSSSFGMPGIGTASVIASTLVKGRGGDVPVMEAADGLLSSPKFRQMAIDYAKNGRTKAVADSEQAVKKSSVYIKWLSRIGSGERTKIAANGPLAYLFSGSEEKTEPKE